MEDTTTPRHVDDERLTALLDRAEIEECLLRYCRGIDRHDAELVKSAYHEDARDDHGARIGAGQSLGDWANEVHDDKFAGHQHYIANTMIELDGDTAHVETYYLMAAVTNDTQGLIIGGGRYVDRFERRAGVWAIADRIVTHEWFNDPATLETIGGLSVAPRQDDRDPVYRRPLAVDRPARLVSLAADEG